jgi:hypothetical protein
MTLIKSILKWFIKPFQKLRRRFIIARAYPKLKKAYDNQLEERITLRKEINKFLKKYFGIDAKSKYIPKDFKNKEEVRMAVCDKFQPEMDRLNLKFTDLFN